MQLLNQIKCMVKNVMVELLLDNHLEEVKIQRKKYEGKS